ncbi:hypothetical protein [Niabella aquatica]
MYGVRCVQSSGQEYFGWRQRRVAGSVQHKAFGSRREKGYGKLAIAMASCSF